MEKKLRHTGTILMEEGRYFIEVAGRRQDLTDHVVAEPETLKAMAGREVEIIYAAGGGRNIVAFHIPEFPPVLCYLWWPRWTCYLPIPDWLYKGVVKQVRANLAKQFLEDEVITQEVFDKIAR